MVSTIAIGPTQISHPSLFLMRSTSPPQVSLQQVQAYDHHKQADSQTFPSEIQYRHPPHGPAHLAWVETNTSYRPSIC